MLALRCVMNTRYEMAALLLSLSLGFKHWAFLGIPAFVAIVPRGSRVRFLVLSLALPLSLAGFTLLVDWEHASRALFSSPTVPKMGHSVPWLDPRAEETGTLVYRILTMGLAVAVAFRLWRGSTPELKVGALSVIFIARPILEPVPHMYYLAPGLAFLLLLEHFTTGRQTRTLLVGLPLLAWFRFNPEQLMWWAAFAAGWLALAYPSIRTIFSRSELRTGAMPALEDPALGVAYERNDRSSSVVLTPGAASAPSGRGASGAPS
jgi:hypothetical protein